MLINVESIALFYSYVRIQAVLHSNGPGEFTVALVRGDAEISRYLFAVAESGSAVRFSVDGLIERDAFPNQYALRLRGPGGVTDFSCTDLARQEESKYSQSLRPAFDRLVHEQCQNSKKRPKLLDVGGRPRSGNVLTGGYSGCDITIVDAEPHSAVTVVADAHEMSRVLPHDHFDFVLCVSVFEHLIMPWKAALEINKVMKVGGVAFISTHQTVGMHDRPRDFFRFSEDAWAAFFNKYTGFEIVASAMSQFVHITSAHVFLADAYRETSGGFGICSVITRKIADNSLAWDVPAPHLYAGAYPG